MFSPDQIRFIEELIDQKIAGTRPRGLAVKASQEYHSVHEIRFLITKHLGEFRQWIGVNEFHLSLLRHFLAQRVTMRELDKEIMKNGRANKVPTTTRFDMQVTNALQNWQCVPFVKTDKTGFYTFAPDQLDA